MDGQHTHAEPFRFTDPRQQRIHDRLSLIGPGPVDFYRAACRLMAMHPPLETTTHLVGHLLREIESALRAVVRVVVEYTEQPLVPRSGHWARLKRGVSYRVQDPVG